MGNVSQDIRFALRQLRKNPGFAAVAIVTLALGIGASAIIFSVVYNGVLYPFPYRSADRLTAISIEDMEHPGQARGMYHLDEVAAFRNGNHTFEDILAYGLFPRMVYSHDNTAVMLNGVGATPNAMQFWGVPPFLGRGFGEQDVASGAAPVVLLNYRFWKREFNGDKQALGKTILLNGKARVIIGVMPPRFQAVGSDVYLPIAWNRPEPAHGRFEPDMDDPGFFWATGIIKKGTSFAAASTDIDVIARQMARLHPENYPKKLRVKMSRLNDVVLGSFKETLLLLFGAVGLLLLISCSNVAGLLLARASARTREIALRAALGASRSRLVRQLLSESLVLAGAGCVLGSALAYYGLKAIIASGLAPLPMEADITLNHPTLAFAIGISVFSTLLCGIAPALHAMRLDVQQGLASTGVNVNAGFQHSRFRSGLVIGQVALSLFLLTCAGLIARSFYAITHVESGVQPDRMFAAVIHFPQGRYTTAQEKTAFLERLFPELDRVPGVVRSTTSVGIPTLLSPRSDVTIPGKPHRQPWATNLELCSETYFQTVGMHLLLGRLLTADDIAGARKVAVVNEALVHKYFGAENPIGRTIKFNEFDRLPESPRDAYFEIVGVVDNARSYSFEQDTLVPEARGMSEPEAFLPFSISGFGDRTIAMDTRVDPTMLVQEVRRTLWSLDPDVVVSTAFPGAIGFSLENLMQQLVYGKQEFAAITFAACAILGLVLAVVGLFSVMSYIVSLKKHDIGVRMALGATQSNILRMMLRVGVVLTGIGAAIGLAAGIALTHYFSLQLHGVSPTDPLTFVLVIVTVMLAGSLACLLPAVRATRVDPIAMLRNE